MTLFFQILFTRSSFIAWWDVWVAWNRHHCCLTRHCLTSFFFKLNFVFQFKKEHCSVIILKKYSLLIQLWLSVNAVFILNLFSQGHTQIMPFGSHGHTTLEISQHHITPFFRWMKNKCMLFLTQSCLILKQFSNRLMSFFILYKKIFSCSQSHIWISVMQLLSILRWFYPGKHARSQAQVSGGLLLHQVHLNPTWWQLFTWKKHKNLDYINIFNIQKEKWRETNASILCTSVHLDYAKRFPASR